MKYLALCGWTYQAEISIVTARGNMAYRLVLKIQVFLILLCIFMLCFPFSVYWWGKNICVFRRRRHGNVASKWKDFFACLVGWLFV